MEVKKLMLEDSGLVQLGRGEAMGSVALLFRLTSRAYEKTSTVSFTLTQFLSPFQVLNRPNFTDF